MSRNHGQMRTFLKSKDQFEETMLKAGDVLIVDQGLCFMRRPQALVGAVPLWFGYENSTEYLRVLTFDVDEVAEKQYVPGPDGNPKAIDATIGRLKIALSQGYMLDIGREGGLCWQEENSTFRQMFQRRRRFVAAWSLNW